MSSSLRAIGGEGLMWLIGAVACLCAAPRVQLFVSAGNGWPRDAPQYHWLVPISCRFQDCKSDQKVTSLTHVCSAIYFTFNGRFVNKSDDHSATWCGERVRFCERRTD